MKKLSLKKQKVTSLSSKEMSQVIGGGEARSDRKQGDCAYSRNHGYTYQPGDNGDVLISGCASS